MTRWSVSAETWRGLETGVPAEDGGVGYLLDDVERRSADPPADVAAEPPRHVYRPEPNRGSETTGASNGGVL